MGPCDHHAQRVLASVWWGTACYLSLSIAYPKGHDPGLRLLSSFLTFPKSRSWWLDRALLFSVERNQISAPVWQAWSSPENIPPAWESTCALWGRFVAFLFRLERTRCCYLRHFRKRPSQDHNKVLLTCVRTCWALRVWSVIHSTCFQGHPLHC